MMLVDMATEQNVYGNFSMFRRSSQPIQIAAASRMFLSARTKRGALLAAQGLGTLPRRKGWLFTSNHGKCCGTSYLSSGRPPRYGPRKMEVFVNAHTQCTCSCPQ